MRQQAESLVDKWTLGQGRSPGMRARINRGRFCTTWFAASVALLLHGLPLAQAHHGPGAYDRTREITVTGMVTKFQFVNPHVLIFVELDDADGAKISWAGELTSPNRLARMAGDVTWHKDLLQPGDTVTLTGHPTHNGAPALLLTRVADADGRVLTSSGR